MRRTARRHRLPLALAAGGLLVLAACGGGTTGDDAGAVGGGGATSTAVENSTSTTVPLIPLQGPPQDYLGHRSQETACGADAPPEVAVMSFSAYEPSAVPAGTTATIVTSCGPIVIELDPDAAPETVASFVFLAEQGYFDGIAFHRIVPQFVIQGGDPTATGRGGPGYVVPDEFPPADFTYTVGTVAMANAGPGTTGSQFFIMVNDAGLPPQFSVFGRVVDGFETLAEIVAVPLGVSRVGERSIPLASVYIESVTIDRP